MEEQDAEVVSQKKAVNKARTARNREECVLSYGEGAKVRLCIRQTEPPVWDAARVGDDE